jgi:GNAT superfamily N-acetyltransferase
MSLQPVTSLTDTQVRELHQLYQNEWWTKGRSLEQIERMLDHSDYVFGLCDSETRNLVAFARLLTDRTFKAFIFDVIVAPAHRKRGVGKVIIDRILAHPDLVSVKHFELYCLPELVPFYERWGFSAAAVNGIVLLRKENAGRAAPS